MKTVVITGAASFIGCYLIDEIRRKTDYNIIAYTSKITKSFIERFINYNRIAIYELDMREYKSIGYHVAHCDYFIPLAWMGTEKEDRNNKEKNRFSKDANFLAVKELIKRGCSKVILIGSQAEYGNVIGEITEQCVCHPNLEYGKYKLELCNKTEDFCKESKVDFVEARLFSVYGFGDKDNKMIMRTINLMAEHKPVHLSSCTQIWDFLHVRDVASGIRMLMELNIENGYYNLGNENRVLKTYIEEIKNILNSKSLIQYKTENRTQPDVIFNSNKIRLATGWKPEILFCDGIKEIYDQKVAQR